MSSIPPQDKSSKLTKTKKRGYLSEIGFTDVSDNRHKLGQKLEVAFSNQTKAIEELQSLQVASRQVDSVGKPVNGARCELFDGQFIRVLQTAAAPVYVRVAHQLGRVPQGAIPVLSSSAVNRVIVESDKSVGNKPATDTEITIRLNGNIGDEHTFILF